MFELAPQAWTKITVTQKTLTGGKKLLSANVKMYLYVNFAGEGWKMSGVFSETPTVPVAAAFSGSHSLAVRAVNASCIVPQKIKMIMEDGE